MPDLVTRAVETPRSAVWLDTGGASGPSVLAVGDTRPDQPTCFALPPIYPEWLGDRALLAAHPARFCYVVGEMARGIATPRMVVAAVQAGCFGFYGSAGLPLTEIKTGLHEIRSALGPAESAWGANLIHSPQEPGQEAAVVDLFLAEGVRRVSASAFMRLTPDVIRYTALGLEQQAGGTITRRNHIFAKVSRAEVAEPFMAPAPEKMLRELVASGKISEKQADLASKVPVAAEITAESDSGGHTDNRPAAVLFSSLSAARSRVAARHGFDESMIRIGLAGGIATPSAVAAAFQMGAAYVLTGSVNQSAVESGLSEAGRKLLAKAGPADVAMAPAADMFEQGVEVQVLKRGTLFAMRGKKLHGFYRAGASYETLGPADRKWLDDVLGEVFDAAWASTKSYIQRVNPAEAERAETDGNKRLALVARRYLFQGAQWAREGDTKRTADYQIWCGPAMGAFNEWVAGTPLDPLENRSVRQIALNLLEGAARVTRAGQLRAMGFPVAPQHFSYTPQLFE
ncbi:MAG: PfaD family polyunsaturated fatty acid/polyketide biosynthesis protein [Hyphomonas sp.]|nr:PfaD family polyunsaturated fatty acid/polyketide biosynthesis protein [Hyphomonas sp.]MBU3921525.1 PfaD family polyunsaturated fatty acid/polyketide biosynthesis protein [Alphaproteobacteria bacterium]MBU4062566.1 PfaD family polyunsaturated fatty acid/polyketide biosynthesis protein [Alphaproteobacteria bacterium]MBU4163917.1 PfaD family polyunsaturated fatty acid/polyketide biosynthesis protein [Alphaproteobacteria bacterium]